VKCRTGHTYFPQILADTSKVCKLKKSLNGDLEEVYMIGSPSFEDKLGSKVCKLNKSLYGL